MGRTDGDSPPMEIGGENDMLKHFDKSMDSVKDCFKRYEQDYIRPLLKKSYAYAQLRPLSAVFLGFFVTLSAFPVLLFLTTSLATITIFTTIAVGIALVAASTIILALLIVLSVVLVAIFFAALFLAFATLSTYFLIHFITLLRKGGPSVALSWTIQTVTKVLMGVQKQSEELAPVGRRSTDVKPLYRPEDQRSSTSEPIALAQNEVKIEGEDFSDYAVKEQGE